MEDISVIALTGVGGVKLKECSDYKIAVPETETHKVQELYLPIYIVGALCWKWIVLTLVKTIINLLEKN